MRRVRSQLALAAALLLAAAFAPGCSKDGPTRPPTPALRALVLGDGGTQDSLIPILQQSGFSVTDGGPYWDYTGTSLGQFDVLVLLCGVTYTGTIPDTVEQKILSFVGAGGGLLTTDWVSYNAAPRTRMDQVAAILPVQYTSEGSGTETYTIAVPSHPIVSGLPSNFDVPSDWSYSMTTLSTDPAKQARSVIAGSASGSAVTTGVYGTGRIVHWSMAGHYQGPNIWSPEVVKLLGNIVNWAGKRS
jgi:trehalose utilization protein